MARTTRRSTQLSGKRGERQDLTLLSRSALHQRPKPFVVYLGSAGEAEASRRFSGSPPGAEAPWRFTCGSPFRAEASPGSPVDPCFWPEPRAVHRSDHRRGRSPGDFPGVLRRPKPLHVPVGSPRPAEALAVRLFRNSVPAEAGRFFRPRPRSGRSRSFVPVGSPSKPKLWRFSPEAPCRPRPIGFSGSDPLGSRSSFRFSFGGPVKPKLLVPPGCSTKLAHPCKS